MNTKDLLMKAVEIITFLFAAFSGFLKRIAPPEETESSFTVGASSMLALAALLFISAASKNRLRKKYKKVWLTISFAFFIVAMVSTFIYKANLDELTFPFPQEDANAERFIRGTALTPDAQSYIKEHPEKNTSDIVADYGGITQKELVWTSDSIRQAKLKLTINYVVLVLSLASTIFCLTEGVLAERKLDRKDQPDP